MTANRFKIQTACPQCGCSAVSHLTEAEIEAKFGYVPNVEMECSACMQKYATDMKDACPEWDEACKLKNAE